MIVQNNHSKIKSIKCSKITTRAIVIRLIRFKMMSSTCKTLQICKMLQQTQRNVSILRIGKSKIYTERIKLYMKSYRKLNKRNKNFCGRYRSRILPYQNRKMNLINSAKTLNRSKQIAYFTRRSMSKCKWSQMGVVSRCRILNR